LVDKAATAGADAVKFQTFKAEQVVTAKGKMAAYQKTNLGVNKSQVEMLRELELKEEFYSPIIKRCREKNIIFLSTPHGGKESVIFLEALKVVAYKIGSGDLTNYLMLRKVAQTKKPIILSSGMATLTEVKAAVEFIRQQGNQKIIVLHCTTNYPCPDHEVNLAAMTNLMKKLNVPVGYSDHTEGPQVAIMAATLGMQLYECHFTLDKSLPGPDHQASCTPIELQERIRAIKNCQVILGSPVKKPTRSEKLSMISTIRKSLVAAHDLKKGQIIRENDLEAKRPGNGLSPILFPYFINKKIKLDLKKDEQLKKKYV
jgi:sialic acid synthase SpsE